LGYLFFIRGCYDSKLLTEAYQELRSKKARAEIEEQAKKMEAQAAAVRLAERRRCVELRCMHETVQVETNIVREPVVDQIQTNEQAARTEVQEEAEAVTKSVAKKRVVK